jgi:cysteine desulfurase/selenocysteine lyase
MNMPTPTSDAVNALAPEGPAELPDAATLTRWANQFFSARPVPPGGDAPRSVSAASITPLTEAATQPDAYSALASAIARLSATDLVHPALPSIGELSRTPATAASAPPPNSSAPSFYFLDTRTADPARLAARHPAFDVHTIRRDFPILQERVHGRPLVWFDNAATTQKPAVVIDRLSHFYRRENSNIHRAAHELAARATDAYEGA